MQVVYVVGTLHKGSSGFDLLIDNIKACLQNFDSVEVCHVRRIANCTTHGMAKLALISNFTLR